MKSSTLTQSFQFLAAALLVLAGLAAVPSTASAQSATDLTKYLSNQNNITVGLNMQGLKKSKYFDDVIEWAKSQAGNAQALADFEKQSGIDLEEDVDTIVVAFRTSNVGSRSRPQQEFAMAVAGDFKNDKLVEAAKNQSDIETKKHGELTYYTDGNLTMALPKDGLVLMTTGKDAYQTTNLATFASQNKSVQESSVMKKMMSAVDTSEDVWMVGDTSSMPSQGPGPQPKSIGMDMNFSSGLILDIVAEMSSAEEAKSSVKQIQTLKKQGGQAQMAAMVGAKPLIDNLTTSRKGSRVIANTKMNQKEFDGMVQSVKQLMKQRGGGTGLTAPPSSGSGSGSSSSSSQGGADADFN